ncbi:C3H1-type domain-containing protein [Balamuthia mandrillaris]
MEPYNQWSNNVFHHHQAPPDLRPIVGAPPLSFPLMTNYQTGVMPSGGGVPPYYPQQQPPLPPQFDQRGGEVGFGSGFFIGGGGGAVGGGDAPFFHENFQQQNFGIAPPPYQQQVHGLDGGYYDSAPSSLVDNAPLLTTHPFAASSFPSSSPPPPLQFYEAPPASEPPSAQALLLQAAAALLNAAKAPAPAPAFSHGGSDFGGGDNSGGDGGSGYGLLLGQAPPQQQQQPPPQIQTHQPPSLPSDNILGPSMEETAAAELTEACRLCFHIIDNPPAEYRLVRQAVQGLVHIAAKDATLRPVVMLKVLQVVQDPLRYRSNPRRYAVRSLGYMTYHDESYVIPSIEVLTELAKRENENSRYVRKAAFCALSRIGRKYPSFQDSLINFFLQHYRRDEKVSVKWGILIGLGRMAQSNSLLRSRMAAQWLESCEDKNLVIRRAGIKGLGHACCPIGNVKNDKTLEKKCYEVALKLLQTGGCDLEAIAKRTKQDPWRCDDVYMVQYSATQCLGLLLRSDPGEWWPKLLPVFQEVLMNPRYSSMLKASVLLTYGKVAYFMDKSNPHFQSIEDLLLRLSVNDQILVSEPACYALVNFSLSHEQLYWHVKDLYKEKLGIKNGGSIFTATTEALAYHLKSWCKLLTRDYHPVLNQCSNVISSHTNEVLPKHLFATSEESTDDNGTASQPKMLAAADDDDEEDGPRPPQASDEVSASSQQEPSPSQRPSPTPSLAAEFQEATVGDIAQDHNKLLELCMLFPAVLLESLIMLMQDKRLFDDSQFINNLKFLLKDYRSQSDLELEQTGILKHFAALCALPPLLKEGVVTMMRYPETLDNSLWISNMKHILPEASTIPSNKGVARAASSLADPRLRLTSTYTPSYSTPTSKTITAPSNLTIKASTSQTSLHPLQKEETKPSATPSSCNIKEGLAAKKRPMEQKQEGGCSSLLLAAKARAKARAEGIIAQQRMKMAQQKKLVKTSSSELLSSSPSTQHPTTEAPFKRLKSDDGHLKPATITTTPLQSLQHQKEQQQPVEQQCVVINTTSNDTDAKKRKREPS